MGKGVPPPAPLRDHMDDAISQAALRSKCLSQFKTVKEMSVRCKRSLFTFLRANPELDENMYLPTYGMHCGEFAVYQILTEHCRKKA